MGTWEEIIAALDALLASPPESVEEVLASLAEINTAIQTLIAEASADGSAEEAVAEAEANADAVAEKMAKVEGIIAKKRKLAELKAKSATLGNIFTTSAGAPPSPSKVEVKGRAYRGKSFKNGEDAYKSGLFMAAMLGNKEAQSKYAEKYGKIQYKSQTTENDVLGGYLVPEEFEAAIAFQREQYGVARSIVQVVSMNSQTRTMFKNDGGTNVYAVGEGQTITASDISFDKVMLRNGKFAAVTKLTQEVVDDAYADIADEVAKDHGFAHAKREDQVVFTSTGGSTYHNFVGLLYKWQLDVANGGGTWTTDADKAKHGGIVVATGSTWSSVTLADITKMLGRVRTDVSTGGFGFLTHQAFYWEVMVPLLQAAGGQTQTERIDGVNEPRFMGYPVKFVEVMPSATAVSDIPLVFGNLASAVMLGDRKGLAFETNNTLGFLEEEIYLKSSTRYGVNCHDIGVYDHSTAANRTRGAVVALATKNA